MTSLSAEAADDGARKAQLLMDYGKFVSGEVNARSSREELRNDFSGDHDDDDDDEMSG